MTNFHFSDVFCVWFASGTTNGSVLALWSTPGTVSESAWWSGPGVSMTIGQKPTINISISISISYRYQHIWIIELIKGLMWLTASQSIKSMNFLVIHINSGHIASENSMIVAYKHVMCNHQPIRACIRGLWTADIACIRASLSSNCIYKTNIFPWMVSGKTVFF